jgi:hypothetical protein
MIADADRHVGAGHVTAPVTSTRIELPPVADLPQIATDSDDAQRWQMRIDTSEAGVSRRLSRPVRGVR